ncbi:Uu.00g120960.m01.CDS01 [Anthostomella pinea]|uniref:Uu.00g120960.m01.CDS01 n=1 Tax=Anthostomella pinea TaxID=933095 RepID=A0AAI8VBN2_9PEZI|nr:Uu.00g120960.m01.CDS01 [Anthostomella pinea]
MGKDAAPKNWPASIPYLSQASSSPHITEAQHSSLRTRPVDLATEIPSHLPRGPSPLVKITLINTPSHPAKGQAGLFAARHLSPGSLIVPYYDRDAGLAVDAEKAGNEARFVNDYRGIAERPNAEFRESWDVRSRQICMAVFVLPASKNAVKKGDGPGIAKGDEILVSYGKGFWGKRKDTHKLTDDTEATGPAS